MLHSPRSPRSPLLFLPLALLALATACGDIEAPELLMVPVVSENSSGPAAVEESRQFIAHLTGAEEAPPVDTRAQGEATFRLSADGSELSYRLMVANIVDVRMAHIHQAATGRIVVWLYPDAPPPQTIPGPFSGVLATGVITADDLTNDLAGEPLEALLELLRNDDAYVNVHTIEHPGGEIRGQIR